MKILVVAAHPDDEVLGCGATMKKWGGEHEVHIAILGEGISSRHADRAAADPAAIAKLRADAERVCTMLGAHSLAMEGLPDNRLDEMALIDVVKVVERLVEKLRPEVILTHHAGDLNIDHGVTFRAVLTATRPMRGTPVREIYSFEVPSATEWAFQRIQPPFAPNVFIAVTDEMVEAKIAALACYESEARPFPHPRSPEAIRALARRWGSVVGHEHAEAFELIRSIRP